MTIRFQLKVKQIGGSCDFELSWGKGQNLFQELDYLAEIVKQSPPIGLLNSTRRDEDHNGDIASNL
jgi:hypothetical protein